MGKIQRALISVSDKTGLGDFAKELSALGVEMVSTGGTARSLKDAGIPVVEISEFTGFPEMLDGRVKTLHPKVHGGLLYLRGNAEHEAQAARHGIKPIDLVVVNLYPFEKTVANPGVSLVDAIENIDIGGPSMLRSAAKNHASVTVVIDPADYPAVLQDIKEHDGGTCEMFRWKLAVKVFETTSRYDDAIAHHLHAERMKAKGEAAAPLPGTKAWVPYGTRKDWHPAVPRWRARSASVAIGSRRPGCAQCPIAPAPSGVDRQKSPRVPLSVHRGAHGRTARRYCRHIAG